MGRRPAVALILGLALGLALALTLAAGRSLAAPYLGPEAKPVGEYAAATLLRASELPAASAAPLRTPAADLAAGAADLLRYRAEQAATGLPDPTLTGGVPAEIGLGLERIWETVAAVSAVAAADPARLQDPAFWRACFTAHAWVPDGGRKQLRLTRYVIYSVPGSRSPTPAQGYAVYGLPGDEAALTLDQAEARRDSLLRYRYTRQDVLAGVYRAGGAAEGVAPPLAWLTLDQHEQALMQGTVAVNFPDGSQQLLNVHRSNGVPYDRSIKVTTQQARYWYFRPIDRPRGWGREPVAGAALLPMASVAGDLYNLGLGRLIALRTADGLRPVWLADTGGAFQPNLHQLDLYTGIYPDHAAFQRATAAVGDYADAWLMTWRGSADPVCKATYTP